ncbi:hypothetical protein [Bradyrhizobium sp. Ai1a-2]|uniref:hypothetical protein n=1 Tax=Bradyrhizobium sp. Ai1a-2 TaxID=196490 RepID=UPI00126795E6|nr:hypothetical protein [Bradyrhizobium sp. Ai1a-2]
MDRDRQQAGEPESSARDGGTATRINDLPREVMDEVAKGLTTDDPVETANNLTNFKLIDRSTRDALQTGPVGVFHARLNRLGTSAKALYDAEKPDNGLPPAHPLDDAFHRADAIAPILKFQSATRKSATVDHILNVSHASSNPGAILALARHLGDLDHVNRRRLLDQAIDSFKQDHPSYDSAGHRNAAMVLISAHDHLDAEQKVRIYDALIDHPELNNLLAGYGEHLGPIRNGPPSMNVVQQGSDLDRSIDAIEEASHRLPPNSANDLAAGVQRVWAIRKIGTSMTDAYSGARAELIGSVRSRGHDVGR